MKRLNIKYDGCPYTLGDTDQDELEARIMAVVTGTAVPFWLRVNEGEGAYRPTDILITTHSQLAVYGIDAE